MKIEPMGENIEKIFKKTSDEVKRAENMGEDLDYKMSLLNRNTDLSNVPNEKEEYLQKIRKQINSDLHTEYAIKYNEKKDNLIKNKKLIITYKKNIENIEKNISKIKEELNSGGVLPVRKEKLQKDLTDLSKLLKIEKNNFDIEVSKTYELENKNYDVPKTPYEKVKLN